MTLRCGKYFFGNPRASKSLRYLRLIFILFIVIFIYFEIFKNTLRSMKLITGEDIAEKTDFKY